MKKVMMIAAALLLTSVSTASSAAGTSKLTATITDLRTRLVGLDQLGSGALPLGVDLVTSVLKLPKGSLSIVVRTGPAVATSLLATGVGVLGALPGLSALDKLKIASGNVSGLNVLPDGIILSGILQSLPKTGAADVVNVLTIVKGIQLKK